MDHCPGSVGAADILDQLADVLGFQTAQFFSPIVVGAGQSGQSVGQGMFAGNLDVSVGADDHDLTVGQLVCQELQQQQRWLVRPLQVIQHQQ